MKDNGSICVYPWLHFQVAPDNRVLPCCKFRNGVVDKNNIITTDMWNTNTYRDIRKKMLAGEKLEECQHCYSLERSGDYSMRTTANRDYNLSSRNFTKEFEAIEFMEIGLDNICNFQCRMCNSRFSSSIKQRDAFFSKVGLDYHIPRYVEKTSRRLDKIKKLDVDWSKLSNVKIIGGEPFMSPSFEPLLDFLLENTNVRKCEISISTNCSFKLSSEIYDKLNQFQLIRVVGSFDSIFEWNNYQRVGGNFEKDIENFFEYIDKIKICKPQVNSVFSVQILNSFNIFDEWWRTNYPEMFVQVDILQYNSFSPHYFPDWYHNWIDNAIDYSTERGRKIENILKDKRGYDDKFYNDFYRQLIAYDTYYGTDIEDLNPELMDLYRKHNVQS